MMYIKADNTNISDIFDEDNFNMLFEVATDPHTRPATLAQIADRPMATTVLQAVAANPNTPEAALSNLYSRYSKSNHATARILILEGLASNPNLPADIVKNLIYCRDDEVIRRYMATNPRLITALSDDELEELQRSEDDAICYGLAHNPAFTEEQRRLITQPEDYFCAEVCAYYDLDDEDGGESELSSALRRIVNSHGYEYYEDSFNYYYEPDEVGYEYEFFSYFELPSNSRDWTAIRNEIISYMQEIGCVISDTEMNIVER